METLMKKFIFFDLFVFNLVFLIAYWLRIHSQLFAYSDIPLQAYWPLLVFSTFVLLLVFLSLNLYKEKRGRFTVDDFLLIFKGLVLTFLIVTATTFLYKATIYSRLIISFTFIFSLVFISVTRLFLERLSSHFMKKEHIVIYRNDPLGKRLLQKIQEHPELGYRFTGFIHHLRDLSKLSKDTSIVFITTKPLSQELTSLVMRYPHLTFKIVPDLLELLTKPLDFHEFQDIPLLTLPKEAQKNTYLVFKRLLDVTVSLFLLILLSPLFLFMAFFVKLTSRGFIIHKQIRVGKDERPFVFYKFRTMRGGISPLRLANEVAFLFKKKHDPRVTLVGKILRRTCLDELPQLWNVLKGDMSLVGPRPHFAEELKVLQGWQKKRFIVRPGMTGMWQISGRHELGFDKTIFLDIYYINHMSFLLDLGILLKTIPAILFSGGRW